MWTKGSYVPRRGFSRQKRAYSLAGAILLLNCLGGEVEKWLWKRSCGRKSLLCPSLQLGWRMAGYLSLSDFPEGPQYPAIVAARQNLERGARTGPGQVARLNP